MPNRETNEHSFVCTLYYRVYGAKLVLAVEISKYSVDVEMSMRRKREKRK